MPKKTKLKLLEFEAIKYKYADDEDGEAFISFRVSMKHKLGAFAVPAKKLLKVKVEILQ